LFGAVTNGRLASLAISAAAASAKPGVELRSVPTAVPPSARRYTPLKCIIEPLKIVRKHARITGPNRVIQVINPVRRGWVNYFAVGNSSECFSFIKDWVEKKVRRHMKRKGFGWMRWSRQWLYETLKLFNGYRVRHATLKAAPA
jgi:hypothetical protein